MRTTAKLFCWGLDGHGELGNDAALTNQPTPVPVVASANWITVTGGSAHTCARRSGTNGRLYCWGHDFTGELGNDEARSPNQPTPVLVAGGSSVLFAAVDAGTLYTCGRRVTTNRLFCWGSNDRGQLGIGVIGGQRNTPVEVSGGTTTWGAFEAGGAHTCALRSNSQLFCWGSDSAGQLGDGGTNTNQPLPVTIA